MGSSASSLAAAEPQGSPENSTTTRMSVPGATAQAARSVAFTSNNHAVVTTTTTSTTTVPRKRPRMKLDNIRSIARPEDVMPSLRQRLVDKSETAGNAMNYHTRASIGFPPQVRQKESQQPSSKSNAAIASSSIDGRLNTTTRTDQFMGNPIMGEWEQSNGKNLNGDQGTIVVGLSNSNSRSPTLVTREQPPPTALNSTVTKTTTNATVAAFSSNTNAVASHLSLHTGKQNNSLLTNNTSLEKSKVTFMTTKTNQPPKSPQQHGQVGDEPSRSNCPHTTGATTMTTPAKMAKDACRESSQQHSPPPTTKQKQQQQSKAESSVPPIGPGNSNNELQKTSTGEPTFQEIFILSELEPQQSNAQETTADRGHTMQRQTGPLPGLWQQTQGSGLVAFPPKELRPPPPRPPGMAPPAQQQLQPRQQAMPSPPKSTTNPPCPMTTGPPQQRPPYPLQVSTAGRALGLHPPLPPTHPRSTMGEDDEQRQGHVLEQPVLLTAAQQNQVWPRGQGESITTGQVPAPNGAPRENIFERPFYHALLQRVQREQVQEPDIMRLAETPFQQYSWRSASGLSLLWMPPTMALAPWRLVVPTSMLDDIIEWHHRSFRQVGLRGVENFLLTNYYHSRLADRIQLLTQQYEQMGCSSGSGLAPQGEQPQVATPPVLARASCVAPVQMATTFQAPQLQAPKPPLATPRVTARKLYAHQGADNLLPGCCTDQSDYRNQVGLIDGSKSKIRETEQDGQGQVATQQGPQCDSSEHVTHEAASSGVSLPSLPYDDTGGSKEKACDNASFLRQERFADRHDEDDIIAQQEEQLLQSINDSIVDREESDLLQAIDDSIVAAEEMELLQEIEQSIVDCEKRDRQTRSYLVQTKPPSIRRENQGMLVEALYEVEAPRSWAALRRQNSSRAGDRSNSFDQEDARINWVAVAANYAKQQVAIDSLQEEATLASLSERVATYEEAVEILTVTKVLPRFLVSWSNGMRTPFMTPESFHCDVQELFLDGAAQSLPKERVFEFHAHVSEMAHDPNSLLLTAVGAPVILDLFRDFLNEWCSEVWVRHCYEDLVSDRNNLEIDILSSDLCGTVVEQVVRHGHAVGLWVDYSRSNGDTKCPLASVLGKAAAESPSLAMAILKIDGQDCYSYDDIQHLYGGKHSAVVTVCVSRVVDLSYIDHNSLAPTPRPIRLRSGEPAALKSSQSEILPDYQLPVSVEVAPEVLVCGNEKNPHHRKVSDESGQSANGEPDRLVPDAFKAYMMFQQKYKPLYDIEYLATNMSYNTVTSSMWTQHKKTYGSRCDELCSCPFDMQALTSALGGQPSPVGFVSCFAPRFQPLIKEAFPEENPREYLDRLYAMWRAHLSQRNFGTECREDCICAQGWSAVFRDVFSSSNKKRRTGADGGSNLAGNDGMLNPRKRSRPDDSSTGTTAKSPVKTPGETPETRPLSPSTMDFSLNATAIQSPTTFSTLFDSSRPLGFYCVTESASDDQTAVCKITSVCPSSESHSRIQNGTTVQEVEFADGGHTIRVEVRGHEDLAQLYERARKWRSQIKIWFKSSEALDPNSLTSVPEQEWQGQKWSGRHYSGWAGGAGIFWPRRDEFLARRGENMMESNKRPRQPENIAKRRCPQEGTRVTGIVNGCKVQHRELPPPNSILRAPSGVAGRNAQTSNGKVAFARENSERFFERTAPSVEILSDKFTPSCASSASKSNSTTEFQSQPTLIENFIEAVRNKSGRDVVNILNDKSLGADQFIFAGRNVLEDELTRILRRKKATMDPKDAALKERALKIYRRAGAVIEQAATQKQWCLLLVTVDTIHGLKLKRRGPFQQQVAGLTTFTARVSYKINDKHVEDFPSILDMEIAEVVRCKAIGSTGGPPTYKIHNNSGITEKRELVFEFRSGHYILGELAVSLDEIAASCRIGGSSVDVDRPVNVLPDLVEHGLKVKLRVTNKRATPDYLLKKKAAWVEQLKLSVGKIEKFNKDFHGELAPTRLSADIRAKQINDLTNFSLLHAAILSSDRELVRRLLGQGADRHAKSSVGSPMVYAINMTDQALNLLEDMTANADESSLDGRSLDSKRQSELKDQAGQFQKIVEDLRKHKVADCGTSSSASDQSCRPDASALNLQQHRNNYFDPSTGDDTSPSVLPRAERTWFVTGGSRNPCGRFISTRNCVCIFKSNCMYPHIQPLIGPLLDAERLLFSHLPDVKFLERRDSHGQTWFTAAYHDTDVNIHYLAESGPTSRLGSNGLFWYPTKEDAKLAVERVYAASKLHPKHLKTLMNARQPELYDCSHYGPSK